jgi:UDP-2,3-diacylglucosamine pyrophosphatase LpxH
MQTNINSATKISVPTLWILDIHLGFHGCSAEFLLDFLHHVDCDTLYLVGDIIDVGEMKKRMFWPQAHNNVIPTLLGKAKHNTKVIYISGHHDEISRGFDDALFGNVELRYEAIHTTSDDKNISVTRR